MDAPAECSYALPNAGCNCLALPQVCMSLIMARMASEAEKRKDYMLLPNAQGGGGGEGECGDHGHSHIEVLTDEVKERTEQLLLSIGHGNHTPTTSSSRGSRSSSSSITGSNPGVPPSPLSQASSRRSGAVASSPLILAGGSRRGGAGGVVSSPLASGQRGGK